MSKLKEANNLVDIAFDEGFETFGKLAKAEKKMKTLLDMCGKKRRVQEEDDELEECGMDGIPGGIPGGHMMRGGMMGGGSMNKGIAKVDYMRDEEGYEDTYDTVPTSDEPNDIPHEPGQSGIQLYKAIRRQLGELRRLNEDAKAEYRKYFNSMLKKYGVSSPAQLDADQKKEFFDSVDAGWKAKKETD